MFMNRIKQLRKANGMTQDDLAKKLHLKRSVVSKYETGAVPLTDRLIVQLSDLFDVSSDYLLDNEKQTPQSEEPELQDLLSELKDMFANVPPDKYGKFKNLLQSAIDVSER